ncbi:hypothetical protein [Ancylomarina sp. 16SWW S1-10-2]|uniref:hypothetical protein n=1 Tax=Ancylomarina sp. 16SWW S1-10-2 TaxID=2499681 RepID=UPI0012AE64D4|nr:hypothetical protein [Ancylomarina sp. 16SWW S1-10-2]MRT91952.1 hypothetical protein [Ancylomarina sp. 16SWW S1-10-2]
MKDKIGFNIIFALMAFTLGLALMREFDFQNFVFRKQALGFLYLIVFIISIYLTFKKKRKKLKNKTYHLHLI